ncbi:hypothetical protein PFLUV_G00145980 [Perca fluviatilis]|uniref:Ig-like domain-containing protein n=1 Tax=Perca fluviatilis TaxID=8168 RepID=A0A6A5E2U1_PERFL|nr:uncharacterized protein LOC120569809 [Perca fluviatilis]KAF1382651.1 hypothetical protein PFLUV_G00145980 [Perca fluviatilis]
MQIQILTTTGGMEDSCKYLGINRTCSLICCMFWIFSPAEGNTISQVVGTKVTLPCKNESKLGQLTWKMNEDILFTYNPKIHLHKSSKALNLSISMSMSERQMYALVIERVQKSHTANYTCEISTSNGIESQRWELIITEREEAGHMDKLVIAVAAVVPCVCLLTFALAFIILQRVCKKRAEDQEQEEDIYENCLEGQRRGFNQPHHNKPWAH